MKLDYAVCGKSNSHYARCNVIHMSSEEFLQAVRGRGILAKLEVPGIGG